MDVKQLESREKTYHNPHKTTRKDKHPNHGHNPMHHLLGSPPVDEQANRKQQASGDSEGRAQTDLRLVLEAGGLAVLDDDIRRGG